MDRVQEFTTYLVLFENMLWDPYGPVSKKMPSEERNLWVLSRLGVFKKCKHQDAYIQGLILFQDISDENTWTNVKNAIVEKGFIDKKHGLLENDLSSLPIIPIMKRQNSCDKCIRNWKICQWVAPFAIISLKHIIRFFIAVRKIRLAQNFFSLRWCGFVFH